MILFEVMLPATIRYYFIRQCLVILLIICINTSYGQPFSYPPVKSKGQTVKDFVPAGWAVLDSAQGDLNKDGLKDYAIVIQYRDSITLVNNLEDTVLAQPRILLLLFRGTDKRFSLIEQTNSFILKHDNPVMDDPYQGIAIDKGVLKIDFHLFYSMGSWYSTSSTYKFRYDGHKFILIGADLSTVHRATLDYEEYSYNFLTKRRSYTKGNDREGTQKTSTKVLDVKVFQTFKTFREPYSFEVENDIYL